MLYTNKDKKQRVELAGAACLPARTGSSPRNPTIEAAGTRAASESICTNTLTHPLHSLAGSDSV
jgi:hypothetical protein